MKANTQTTTKQAHIQRQRVEGAQVKAFIKKELNLSELHYNTMQYELGLLFLQEIFPIENAIYYKYHIYHERQKTFWLWWKAQWHIYLQDYVKFIIEHDVNIDYGMFEEEMMQLVHESMTETSFYTYLKLYKDVEL